MFDERWNSDVTDVASTLRSLLADKSPEALVREAEASDAGWSPELRKQLDAFGLFDLPVEAELLSAVAMEIGRSLAPVPWPEVAAVHAVLGIDNAAYALDGLAPAGAAKAVVAAGDGAALVAAEGDRGRTAAGDVLVRVPSSENTDFDADEVTKLSAMMRLLAAARLVGAARRLVEIGVDYAKERHAFGKPIGSYQAVSHKLADAAIAVEGAELLVKKTAFLAQHGADVIPPIFASMVWANAVDAGRLVAGHVHQCMGGFGATLEYPAQLYSRRIRSWALRLGRPRDVYREVGRELLDSVRRSDIVGLWHEDRGIGIPRWVRELDTTMKR